MQDYERWTVYAPMVLRVEVVHPGDAQGNGLLRRVSYRLPLGRRGSALELVTAVTPARRNVSAELPRSLDPFEAGFCAAAAGAARAAV